jgi:mRNA interferase MazF
MNQYEIILVNLDPTVGSEIEKTRPCVIISPDEINHNLQTLVVAPMTTTSRNYPTRVEVQHNDRKGWIAIDQIRTIDKMRVVKVLDRLDKAEIRKVKSIIKETFVD